MQINISLNLSHEQVQEFLTWIFKDGAIEKISMGEDEKQYNDSLYDWDISVRLTNILRTNNINTVKDLIQLGRSGFMKLRTAGRKALVEIECIMKSKGLKFKSY